MSEHISADGYPVEVGKKFWGNDLRVVRVTVVADHSNKYQEDWETKKCLAIQTWHRCSESETDDRGHSFDTLDSGYHTIGRLARYFGGKDAEAYPAGTNYADVK